MTLEVLLDTLSEFFFNISQTLSNFLPYFLSFLFIVILGLTTAFLLQTLWLNITKMIDLEKYLSRLQPYSALVKANKTSSVSELVSLTIWLVTIFSFTIPAAKILALYEVDEIILEFLDFLPLLGTISLYLIFGSIIATLTYHVTITVLLLGQVKFARTIALLSALAIMIFTFSQIFGFLDFSEQFIQFITISILASLALAFGLAGRETATNFLKKFKDNF